MEKNDTSLIEKAWNYYDDEDYDQARIYFEQALEAGNIEAVLGLGNLYYHGRGVEQDYKRAVKYYEMGAKKGDVDCIANLGRCYYWGRGVAINLELSAFYCELAAKAGDPVSMYDMALNYQRGLGVKIDIKKSLFWLEQAANNWESDALDELGCIYATGDGVKKNEKKAVDYYMRGVEAGSHLAMLLLADYYVKGHIVAQDLEKAENLYRESFNYYYEQAVKGDQKAQLRLGNIYYYGGIPMIDVPQDYVEAARWYDKSAEQGDPHAQINMANLYNFGIGVEQNYKKAVYWYRCAAEKNDEVALCNLANAYSLGRGVEQDEAKAAELYRKSANLGYPNAQVELGKCYLTGKGVEQNYLYATDLLQKACENGAKDAFGYLGDCYRKGNGVEKDEKKALALYQEGADRGDLETKIRLAEAYIEGWGIPTDSLKAKEILIHVCGDEEMYRSKRISVINYSDDFGREFIENPLDPLNLKHYAKANYLLGVLNYSGDGSKPDPNEAIRRFRMADKLGYIDENHPNESVSALLEKIIGSTVHEDIRDTLDCYVEVRESNDKGERYQVVIHHSNESESVVKFKGRNKFLYILALLIAYEGKSVYGLTTNHFSYMRDELSDMASDARINANSYEEWIDEFIYAEKPEAESMRKKEGLHIMGYCSLNPYRYSNAFSGANKAIKACCISNDEYETFKLRSTGGRSAVTTISIEPTQVKLPNSLMLYLDSLPTQNEIANYKPKLSKWMSVRE